MVAYKVWRDARPGANCDASFYYDDPVRCHRCSSVSEYAEGSGIGERCDDSVSKMDNDSWAHYSKRAKVVIWTSFVLLGAAFALPWNHAGQRSLMSTIGVVGAFVVPIIGSTLVVYGNISLRRRPVDERQQATFLLSAFGVVLSMAIAGAIITYLL